MPREQLSDSDLHRWYGMYCNFLERTGQAAIELLPEVPSTLRQWYATHNRPEPFEAFEFHILRMSPEQREEYIASITLP